MSDMDWDINGHTWAAHLLQQHIAGGRMRHAYLFTGSIGVGRRTLALRFAQAVNCTQPPAPGFACGKCRTCQQIHKLQYPDLAIVQSESAGSVLKIEQIRDLQHHLSLAPYEGKYRVALLLRFEEANESAQNAILKTLEEPNPKVLLLLTANDPENLLPTIVSRCELFRLRPMEIGELARLLASKENLSKEQANLIAHISAGRVGYAKQFAGNKDLLDRRLQWLNDLLRLLGANRIDRFQFTQKIIKNSNKDRAESRDALWEGLGYWLSFWRDVMLTTTESGTQIVNIDLQNAVEKTAECVSTPIAVDIVRTLEHTFVRMPHANLQLMLDTILLNWPVVKVN